MLHLFKNKLIAIFLLSIFSFQQIVFASGDTTRPYSDSREYANNAPGINIYSDFAQVEKTYFSGDEGHTIINIQDCHASLANQYSIVNILEELMSKYELNMVAVEGGSGYIDTSILKSYPDKRIRKNTAEYLMEKSYISAGEFFAVTKDEDVALYGVENDDLYKKNVELFRKIYKNCKGNIAVVDAIISGMIAREEEIYRGDLRQTVYRSRLHNTGKLALNIYWEFLTEIAGKNDISLQEYRNIREFTDLVRFEKKIDFKKVTEERERILGELVDLLSGEQLAELVRKTVELEENKIARPAYYQGLLKTAELKGINVRVYPELLKYSEYITRYWRLNVLGIQTELDKAEAFILASLFENDMQRQYYEFQRLLSLIRKLFVVKLSGKEAVLLEKKISSMDRSGFTAYLTANNIIKKTGKSLDPGNADRIFDLAGKYLDFYKIAEKRNAAILSNTVKCMKNEGKRVAALITGGYHSGGLTDIMREKGLSYLVLMPRTFEDKERPYVAVLTKRAEPVREIAEAGEYSLALEVGVTKRREHFKEMLAFIIGQNLLMEKNIHPETQKWINFIKQTRDETIKNRVDAMRIFPMGLDSLEKWIGDIKYRKVDRPGKVFRIDMGNDHYLVSAKGLEVIDDTQKKVIKKIFLSELVERIEEFKDSLGGSVGKQLTKMGQLAFLSFFYQAIASVTLFLCKYYSRSQTRKTKVVLVNLFNPQGRHLTLGFPLSVESMAGDIRAKYGDNVQVKVIDMQQGINNEQVLDILKKEKADILGLSIKTGEHIVAQDILNAVYDTSFPSDKRPPYIVIGGHRPRVYADEFLEKYDDVIVCQGEGEPAMRGLVELNMGERDSLKDVPNVKYKSRGFNGKKRIIETDWEELDFDEYSLPGIDTLNFVNESGGIVYWEASRGCSWAKCRFCNRFFCRNTSTRVVPVEKLVEGFELLSRKKVKHVFFADTDFLQNDPERTKRLAAAIIEGKKKGTIDKKLNFWIQSRAGGIFIDPVRKDGSRNKKIEEENKKRMEALKLLKEAGLGKIFIGVESGSEKQLQRYNKGVNIRSLKGAIDRCRSLGVMIEVGLIPIGPFTSLTELGDTIDFVEKTQIQDSIVKVLNLMCVEENTDYYEMVSGAAKGYDENLITGVRNEETLLFPWRMKDPDMEIIKTTAAEWMRENGHFIYALRRIVDATEVSSSAEHHLRYFRRLHFSLLKALKIICSIESSGNIAEQLRQLEYFKKLDLLDRQSLEDLAQYVEDRIIREVNFDNKRRARDFAVGKIKEMTRNARDQGLSMIMKDIETGVISGPTAFLEIGIDRIKKETNKLPVLLPVQDKFDIVLGIPEDAYEKLGTREIRRLRAGIVGLSDIVSLSYGLREGENISDYSSSGRMNKLLSDLKKHTSGMRCISAILDVDDIDGQIEETIKGFVEKVRADFTRYADPAISLTVEDLADIDNLDLSKKSDIKEILVKRHPNEETLDLNSKTMYDLRVDEIRDSLKEKTYSNKVKNYLAGDEKLPESRNIIVTTVDELIDVKLLVGSLHERKERMYGRKDTKDLIKDFVIIRNDKLTEENKNKVLEKTGIYDYVSPEQVIVLKKGDILSLDECKSRIEKVASRQWGIESLSWKNIAIAEKAGIIDIESKRLPSVLREAGKDNLLYVKLGKLDGEITGIVSQLYKMTVEIMANKDMAKHVLKADLTSKEGYLYFTYIPKARAFDYDAEVVSYEIYVLKSL